ncbi:HdeD family acid-resistance protein [Cetobacterium ceti]
MKKDYVDLNNSLKVLWKYHILFGILFVLLGGGAIIKPNFFSISIIYVIGWFILFLGIGNIYYGLSGKDNPSLHWGTILFQGFLEIFSGLLILFNPFYSIYFVVLYFGIFLLFRGCILIFGKSFSLTEVSYLNGIRSLIIVNGILDILFGILSILAPFFIETLIIYILAFYCFLGGLLLIIFGFQIKNTFLHINKKN